MKYDTALKLFNLIDDYAETIFEFKIHKLTDKEMESFQNSIDLDYVIGIFSAENIHESLYLIFVDWRGQDNYYIVIRLKDNINPLVELHNTRFIEPFGITLEWNYNPRKRDGKNEKRIEYFNRYFGSVDVSIAVPTSSEGIQDFFDDIFSLVTNRLKADYLSSSLPEIRFEFPEGRLTEKIHTRRERNANLVKLAKQNMKRSQGKLVCQVCSFDFEEMYGALGEGFIEAHHTIPVSELDEDAQTRIEDIALVCSNCHRMLHRRRPWLEMHQLKNLLN